jgi:hypothetical protein
MVIVTAQAIGTLKPEMSVHGDIIKIDLGAILIELDKEGFKDLISDLITQAAKHQIYIRNLK